MSGNMNLRQETTFLMVKPDGVLRGLTGEIIKRIERTGLKIVALKLFKPPVEQIDNHYPKDEAWITRLGQKSLTTYEKFGLDAKKELGSDQAEEIGPMVRKWLLDYMTMGPVVVMAIRGVHAVDMVRKLSGPTMPIDADMGTIRGDFSIDSAALANTEKRGVFNLVHASETQDEAQHEIAHWFGEQAELCDYNRADDMMFQTKE